MVHYCKIEGGKLNFEKWGEDLFKKDLQEFEGLNVMVNIGNIPKGASKNQENYFHLVLNLLGKETGYSLEDLKNNIKQMFGFCEKKINPITNECYDILKSSKDLTSEEYSYLITCTLEFIREFYPEFNIPDPELFNLQKGDYERAK